MVHGVFSSSCEDFLCVVAVCDLCLFLMVALLVCSLPGHTYFQMFSLVVYLHL